jgi:hypothetical protein
LQALAVMTAIQYLAQRETALLLRTKRPMPADFILVAGPLVRARWFSADAERAALVGIDMLARDPIAFAEFENGLPKMQVDWFDDTIELASWDHIPAGFIQTSGIYDHAALEAQRRGWPMARLHGTHLDPTLRPLETAEAILSLSRRLGAVSKMIDGG